MSNYRNIDTELKAQILKALGNPHRLAILEQLTECCGPGTVYDLDDATAAFVGELGQNLGIAPSTLSHHLKELANAGLIQTQRRGKNVACWVDPETLAELAAYFKSLLGPEAAQGEKTMEKTNDEIRQATMEKYSQVAQQSQQGCCGPAPATAVSCCGTEAPLQELGSIIGYSKEELESVPEGANMGLGCGNPQAIAALQPGETVLDLGAGGGFDCFLAARQVGPEGRVIGVDMTPDMVAQARANVQKGDFGNVEFRLGEIEHLPVADSSVDVILSNCVINLAPDKVAVYAEAFRVLAPGGRLAISDVVATAALPEDVRQDMNLWAACAAGALLKDDLERILAEAGFESIRVNLDEGSRVFIDQWAPGKNLGKFLASAKIEAVKPAA